MGLCVRDYISSLKGLEYPSQAYVDARSECHKRSAKRILFLANHCGGVYFKAGQYIGTLEKIAPKEYCDELKRLQDQADQRPFDVIKVSYDNDHGYPIENDFDQIEQKALGAASLA